MSYTEKVEIKGLSDSLENLVAQLGTEKDKRFNSRFVKSGRLSHAAGRGELNALYREDAMASKIVDIIPDDMTREWREFTGDMDPEVLRTVEQEENRLQLRECFNEAHKWARLYGTSFIIMSIDDGQRPDVPLNIDKIKLGGLRHLKVVDKYRVTHADIQPTMNPLDPNFGYPECYRFNETAVKIHNSRVLRFDGRKLPFDEFRENNYFSDSVLAPLYDRLTDFNTTCSAASSMVYETNVDIIKIKNFMQYLQTSDGEAVLRKRFALANMLKSFNNALLLDSEEDFQNKTNTFAGLPELLDRFGVYLSSASDIPATRLLGTSASGLNATGEGDLKNYYDTIRAKQVNSYKPKLDYFDVIMFKSLGINESDISYAFKSLFQTTPKELAEVQVMNAQRDSIYLSSGVVTEVSIAKELRQTETYRNITDEEIEELEVNTNEFETDPETVENRAEQENENRKQEES